jgi:hypothetical protein
MKFTLDDYRKQLGALPEAPSVPTDSQENQLPYTWVDGDTVKSDDGTLYRIQGFDAPEMLKFLGDQGIKAGTMGGTEAAIALRNLANKTGYTTLKDTGEQAAYGRKTGILINDRGESFTDRIIKEGVLAPTIQTDQSLLDERNTLELFKGLIPDREDTDEFAKAGKIIKDAMISEGFSSSNFKAIANNEKERLMGKDVPGLYSDTVLFRSPDRTIDNEALNPKSVSWDAGVMSLIESSYGVASLVGATFGIDSLKEFGDAGVYRTKRDIEDLPSILLDYKEVEGFGDAMDFLGNNIAMSIPYMGMTVGSVLAAPTTSGASLSIPVSVYAGQVWNEQPEGNKNAVNSVGAGIIMATLDRLGLKGALKGVSGSPSQLFNAAVNAKAKDLAGDGPVTDAIKKQASELVSQMSKREVGALGKEVVEVMSNQLKSKTAVMDLLKRVSQGTAIEGSTEALQESIGYVAANLDSDTIDFTELHDRAISAAVAGGAIGGALGSGGAAVDYAKWADVAWRQAPALERDKIEAQRYVDKELEDFGYVRSIQSINEDTLEALKEENREGYKEAKRLEKLAEKLEFEWSSGQGSFKDFKKAQDAYMAKLDEVNSANDINTIADRYEEKYKSMGVRDKAFDALNRIPELWRNSVLSIIPKELQAKSRTARELLDTFGGSRNRVFSGSDYESQKHHIVSKYKSAFGDVTDTWVALNGGRRPNSKRKAEISAEVYKVILAASDPKMGGNFNPELVPANTPNGDVIAELGKKMQELATTMHEDQLPYNKDLGYIGNYLAKYKTISKGSVAKDPQRFTQLLIDEYGMDPKLANNITDNLINNNEVSTIEEAVEAEDGGEFSSTRGSFKPSSHNRRTLGLSENDKFQDFMEQDIFSNISYAAKAAARYQANQQFVGHNGAVIGKKLNEAVRKGELTQDEADKIAYGLRNYLDAESGNYKRPKTETGKQIQNIQRNFIFYTTIAGLPLATISSIVELALTMNALTAEQIFGSKGREGGLKKMGNELARMLWQGTQETFSTLTTVDAGMRASAAQKRLRDLGFYDWDVGAATKTGVTETSALKQKFIQGFFKANGLQGFTQMTRAIRLSIAGDYIFDHLDTILNSDLDNPTKGSLESIQSLRNLGIDMDPQSLSTMHEVMNKDRAGIKLNGFETAVKNEFFREAEYSFVNQAIMLPGAANRPLWLQDPRFALFNQFQGFISTFTSTFLPRLWGDYVKRGSPAMKYNAFATMATMILLGFVSQSFKDRLKYGEASPYLDQAEWIRRGVSSSGLLGSSERVINTLYPMYETRSDGVFQWAWNEGTGQSPALGTASTLVGGVGDLIKGDTQRSVDKLLRGTPVGPITWLRKDLAALAGGN